MNWREAIREGFPSPRDQEPAELRQDIADELADHLACALRHELRRTDDESEARRRVLERFGDPKRLAYRLWFDAMRETIMKDRVLLVGMVVVVAACFVTCAMTWRMLQQSQEVSHALLAKLEGLSFPTVPATVPSGNWARVTIQLVRGSRDGPPVVGHVVKIMGKPFNDSDREEFESTSDDDGVVSFGPFRPGTYRLLTTVLSQVQPLRKLTLFAGHTAQETVTFPAECEVVCSSIVWPSPAPEGRLLRLWFEAVGSTRSRKVVDGSTWWSYQELIVTADGTRVTGMKRAHDQELKRRVFKISGELDEHTTQEKSVWFAWPYRLKFIEFLRRVPATGPNGETRYDLEETFNYPDGEGPVYEIRTGRVNELTISIPNELIERVESQTEKE